MDHYSTWYIVYGNHPSKPEGSQAFQEYEDGRDYYTHLLQSTDWKWLAMRKYVLVEGSGIIQNAQSTLR